jgi:hypothetical protein
MEQLLCGKIRHVIAVPTPRPGGRVPQAVYVLSVPRTHHHSPPSTATGFDSEPYPAQSVRERVSVLTALTLKQVNMWYANARTRLKRKGGELRGSGCKCRGRQHVFVNEGDVTAQHCPRAAPSRALLIAMSSIVIRHTVTLDDTIKRYS